MRVLGSALGGVGGSESDLPFLLFSQMPRSHVLGLCVLSLIHCLYVFEHKTLHRSEEAEEVHSHCALRKHYTEP
jgi:hypothetical protein